MSDFWARPPESGNPDQEPTDWLTLPGDPAPEETLVDRAPYPNAQNWLNPGPQDYGYTPTPGLAGPGLDLPPAASRPTNPPPQPQPYRQPDTAQPSQALPPLAPPPPQFQNYPPPTADVTPTPQPTTWSAGSVQPYRAFGGPPVSDHPSSTTALVLGIIAILGVWPLGPFAWYLGAKGRREIRQQPGRWGSSGGLTVGMILGILTTIPLALIVFGFTFFLLLAVPGSFGP